jgi:hypothetical protein
MTDRHPYYNEIVAWTEGKHVEWRSTGYQTWNRLTVFTYDDKHARAFVDWNPDYYEFRITQVQPSTLARPRYGDLLLWWAEKYQKREIRDVRAGSKTCGNMVEQGRELDGYDLETGEMFQPAGFRWLGKPLNEVGHYRTGPKLSYMQKLALLAYAGGYVVTIHRDNGDKVVCGVSGDFPVRAQVIVNAGDDDIIEIGEKTFPLPEHWSWREMLHYIETGEIEYVTWSGAPAVMHAPMFSGNLTYRIPKNVVTPKTGVFNKLAAMDIRKHWRRFVDTKDHGKKYAYLTECVRAHIKYPDRIDVLAELYSEAVTISAWTFERICHKFPAVQLYRDKVLSYDEWEPVLEVDYRLGNRELGPNAPWIRDAYGLHVSTEDETKIAYYPTVKQLDRMPVRTTLGRWLAKYFPHVQEQYRKQIAEKYAANHTPVELKIARSASEIARVIGDGPSSSCMSNGYYDEDGDTRWNECAEAKTWYLGHEHPAVVYGYADDDPTWDTDIEVLYFEKDEEVKARVVCNAKTKQCARIYGDEEKLRRAMTAAGYRQETGALIGARIRKVKSKNHYDAVLIPYIDAGVASGGGNLYVTEKGERHYVITESGYNTYLGYECKGVMTTSGSKVHSSDDDDEDGGNTCDHCGEVVYEELTSVEDGDRYVCSHCLDNDFIEARVWQHGRGEWDYILTEDATVIGDTPYRTEDLWRFDIHECVITGEFLHVDDLALTSRGYVNADLCVELEEPDDEGGYWAYEEDTVEIDGKVYHEDSIAENWFTGEALVMSQALVARTHTYGVECFFTEEDFVENIDEFAVLGNELFLFPSARCVERGAVPLVEYLRVMSDTEPMPRGTNWGDPSKWEDVLREQAARIKAEQTTDKGGSIEKLAA